MFQLGTTAKTLQVDPIDWPRCYCCNAVVEQFEIVDTGSAVTMISRCHGKEQCVTLDDSIWDSYNSFNFELQEAFAPMK